MKNTLLFSLVIIMLTFSCSYLPDEQTNEFDYEETSEYIKLSSQTETSTTALIFVPGGLVDPHAYITLMQKVANSGIDVYILKVSANLAVLEIQKPLAIINSVTEISHWYIAGHSLGGITAQAFVQKNPDIVDGLIFLGVYPSEGYSIANWDKNVLSIYAENDGLSSIEEIEANKDYIPTGIDITEPDEFDSLSIEKASTLYYLIKGGNHSQFGDYGHQNGDGDATISAEEQHNQISTIIVKFINWDENN